MLSILSNIRRSLLNSGASRRYMLYALGEFILIVVGILVAMEINNWNEWRKDRAKESEYLGALWDDIKIDTAIFSIRLRATETKLLSLEMFLSEEIFDLASFKDTSQWLETLFDSRGQMFPPINKNALTDLTSTGNLNIIRNRVLMNQILHYYSMHQNQSELLSNNFTTWPSIFSQILPGKIQSRVRSGIQTISKEDLAEFYINYKAYPATKLAINAEMGYAQLLIIAIRRKIETAKSIISAIETELSQ